jgi:hypothetical protein
LDLGLELAEAAVEGYRRTLNLPDDASDEEKARALFRVLRAAQDA